MKETFAPEYATLDEWIKKEAIPFAVDAAESLNAAVDKVVSSLDGSVELLGFGEALHGGEDILLFRNRLFQRLVEAHGYCAIAIESSFPPGRAVDEYIAGRGPESFEAVRDTGFSHGFGRLGANRELVEWMRLPTPTLPAASSSASTVSTVRPKWARATAQDSSCILSSITSLQLMRREPGFFMNGSTLSSAGTPTGRTRRRSWTPRSRWACRPAATELRVETEDLIAEISVRRPELAAQSGDDRYLEAVHYASAARQLLGYHAALARSSGDRTARLLGRRDAMMADNLAYIVDASGAGGRSWLSPITAICSAERRSGSSAPIF